MADQEAGLTASKLARKARNQGKNRTGWIHKK
jgi:hypothetical protein